MKHSKVHGFVLCITCAVISLLSAPAFGATIVNVDENGLGTLNGTALPATVFMEPISGQATLVYSFIGQTPFNSGDVLIEDSDGSTSDLLRFNGSTVPALYVFSDIDPGPQSLADTGIPTLLFTSVTLTETSFGPGVDGVVYTPGPNQPGYFGTGVTYNFVGDTPEPATWMLLTTAPFLCLLRLLRRRPLN
jgi:hypothetical protein